MIEMIPTFFFTTISLVIITILFVIAVLTDNKFGAAIAAPLAIFIVITLYSIPLEYIILYSIAYILIGILWSFYAYRNYVKTSTKEHIEYYRNYSDNTMLTSVLARLKPEHNISLIVSYIIIWPISMVFLLTSDIFTALSFFVKYHLKSIYMKIFESINSPVDNQNSKQ